MVAVNSIRGMYLVGNNASKARGWLHSGRRIRIRSACMVMQAARARVYLVGFLSGQGGVYLVG